MGNYYSYSKYNLQDVKNCQNKENKISLIKQNENEINNISNVEYDSINNKEIELDKKVLTVIETLIRIFVFEEGIKKLCSNKNSKNYDSKGIITPKNLIEKYKEAYHFKELMKLFNSYPTILDCIKNNKKMELYDLENIINLLNKENKNLIKKIEDTIINNSLNELLKDVRMNYKYKSFEYAMTSEKIKKKIYIDFEIIDYNIFILLCQQNIEINNFLFGDYFINYNKLLILIKDDGNCSSNIICEIGKFNNEQCIDIEYILDNKELKDSIKFKMKMKNARIADIYQQISKDKNDKKEIEFIKFNLDNYFYNQEKTNFIENNKGKEKSLIDDEREKRKEIIEIKSEKDINDKLTENIGNFQVNENNNHIQNQSRQSEVIKFKENQENNHKNSHTIIPPNHINNENKDKNINNITEKEEKLFEEKIIEKQLIKEKPTEEEHKEGKKNGRKKKRGKKSFKDFVDKNITIPISCQKLEEPEKDDVVVNKEEVNFNVEKLSEKETSEKILTDENIILPNKKSNEKKKSEENQNEEKSAEEKQSEVKTIEEKLSKEKQKEEEPKEGKKIGRKKKRGKKNSLKGYKNQEEPQKAEEVISKEEEKQNEKKSNEEIKNIETIIFYDKKLTEEKKSEEKQIEEEHKEEKKRRKKKKKDKKDYNDLIDNIANSPKDDGKFEESQKVIEAVNKEYKKPFDEKSNEEENIKQEANGLKIEEINNNNNLKNIYEEKKFIEKNVIENNIHNLNNKNSDNEISKLLNEQRKLNDKIKELENKLIL